jgi:hypothetical protein
MSDIKMEIQHVFTFHKILFPFVSIIWANLINSRCLFMLLKMNSYKDCMKFFDLEIVSKLNREFALPNCIYEPCSAFPL